MEIVVLEQLGTTALSRIPLQRRFTSDPHMLVTNNGLGGGGAQGLWPQGQATYRLLERVLAL